MTERTPAMKIVMKRNREPRPTFVLRIEGKRDSSIRALRWVLKTLLRQHGFRCVEAIEERNDGGRQS